jgi:hypothetical protein
MAEAEAVPPRNPQEGDEPSPPPQGPAPIATATSHQEGPPAHAAETGGEASLRRRLCGVFDPTWPYATVHSSPSLGISRPCDCI